MPDNVWHTEVLSADAADLLRNLGDQEYMRAFYLAGGTALALHLGHRRSIDLDFFSEQSVAEDLLLSQVENLPEFSLVAKEPQTLHCQIQRVKVSFIGYPYPMLAPCREYSHVAIADPVDIACMKLSAIASRGVRRDFIDLHQIARRDGLNALLEAFQKKFAKANFNLVHVLKSLVYFADAEKDPTPDMLTPHSWEQLKEYFRTNVSRINLT
jgi:predicted nucleotidyltransferase component of viral defense system